MHGSFESTIPERIWEESKAVDLSASLHKRFNLETRAPYNLEAVRML